MILSPALTLQSMRKVGRFSPLSLEPYLWIDVSKLGLVDNAQIASFNEFSPNGYTVSQSVSGQRPIFKTGVQNGLPGMSFDGIDDCLQVSTMRLPESDVSMFFAGSTNVLDGNWQTIVVQNSRRVFTGVSGGFNSDPNTLVWFYNADGDPGGYAGGASAGVAFQYSVTENSGSNDINTWLNGAAGAQQSVLNEPPQGANEDMRIGCYVNDAQFFWNGYMFEIIICPAVTDAVRIQVQKYLKAKWGTP